MEIKNHKLVGAEWRPSKNTSGDIREHKFLVIHQDFGHWEGTTSWITTQTKVPVSYHLFISKTGEVRQFVDLNKRAYHAGVSSWKGYSSLNQWGIGVCFQNLANEPYTDAQINKGIEVCKLLMDHYNYEDILRHKDIAPGRKTDPESPFPWESFKNQVLSKDSTEMIVTKKVTASALNLREGIGTNFKSIGILENNTEVNVLSEKDGWSEVFVCSTKQHGWVSSTHIK